MRVVAQLLPRLVVGVAVLAMSASAGAMDWGPRVGVSSDPDQIFGGVQFDGGNIWQNTRFMPSVQAGLGDDTFSLCGAAGLHYIFTGMQGKWQPYVGGELGFIYINVDQAGDDFSDTDLALSAAAGLQSRLSSGRMLNFELRIGFIDAQDLQFHVGWMF